MAVRKQALFAASMAAAFTCLAQSTASAAFSKPWEDGNRSASRSTLTHVF